MLQSPQGQAPVDHELGALPLDWVEPKPLPKNYVSKKKDFNVLSSIYNVEAHVQKVYILA